MKVIFAGPIQHGNTCYARFAELCRIEPETVPFDSYAQLRMQNVMLQRIENRIFFGPTFRAANRALCQQIERIRPRVLWVDKGYWIWPSTLRFAKRMGVLLAHHNTDAIRPRSITASWSYTLLRRTLPTFDYYFTTNIGDVEKLRVGGLQTRVELTYIGYDRERFDARALSEAERREYASEIIFVGHHEPRTERGISALVESGLPAMVYGYGWKKAARGPLLKRAVHARELGSDEYVKTLKAAKIALCFVSEINGNQTAARSFEIPACGTFLLAMRTRQHTEAYSEGIEAEFFGDADELVTKASVYLRNDTARQRIALAGEKRCRESDYSWQRYMRDDWEKIVSELAARQRSGLGVV